MPLAELAANSIRRLVKGDVTKLASKELTAADRQAARELLDGGGKLAQDTLGLGIGSRHAPRSHKPVPGGALPASRQATVNKLEGRRREKIVEKILKLIFPAKDGYKVLGEAFLRDRKGEIAVDELTNQARRIDFVVLQHDQIVKSLEVTSPGVDKSHQLLKEAEIKRHGGRYLTDPETHQLIKFPPGMKTKVIRLK